MRDRSRTRAPRAARGSTTWQVRRVLPLAALVALGACTPAEDGAPPVDPPRTTASPSPSATTDAPPTSAAALWGENPGLAPDGLDRQDLVLDATGVGPGAVELPDLGGCTEVLLALRCSRSHAYELTLVGSEPADAVVSGGTDCSYGDAPGTNTYLTPPLPASITAAPSVVRVRPGAGVAYALSVFGTPSS